MWRWWWRQEPQEQQQQLLLSRISGNKVCRADDFSFLRILAVDATLYDGDPFCPKENFYCTCCLRARAHLVSNLPKYSEGSVSPCVTVRFLGHHPTRERYAVHPCSASSRQLEYYGAGSPTSGRGWCGEGP